MSSTAQARLNTTIETARNFREAVESLATGGKIDLDVVTGGLDDILSEAGKETEPTTGDLLVISLHQKLDSLIDATLRRNLREDSKPTPAPAKKLRKTARKVTAKKATPKRKVTGRSLFARKGRK